MIEIVYETNFGDFHKFLPNSRNNPREKSTSSQSAKLNPREKKTFVSFSELAKLTFLHRVLHQLTMVMSKIFYRISNHKVKRKHKKGKDNIKRKL